MARGTEKRNERDLVRRGDILLWLLPGGSYAVNAKVKFGHVSSELEGAALNHYLIGQRFERTSQPSSHRLHLRMGFGGMTIQEIAPEAIGPRSER